MTLTLLRACAIAACLTYGSGRLHACAARERVHSSAHLEHHDDLGDDELSLSTVLWSYFSAFVAYDASDTSED